MECPHCGKRITRAARLRDHIAAVHEGRRDHECPHCQKRFGFARGLREHVRLAHENVRPHSCGLCGQSFHKAADLRAHAAIHERRGFVHRSGREALVERLLRREELPFQRQLRVDFTDGSSHGGHALLDFALERDWGLIALEVDEGQHASREQADECRRMLEVPLAAAPRRQAALREVQPGLRAARGGAPRAAAGGAAGAAAGRRLGDPLPELRAAGAGRCAAERLPGGGLPGRAAGRGPRLLNSKKPVSVFGLQPFFPQPFCALAAQASWRHGACHAAAVRAPAGVLVLAGLAPGVSN